MTDITPTQQNVLHKIRTLAPVDYDQLTGMLNVKRSTARDHVNALRSAGIPIEEDTRGGEKVFMLGETGSTNDTKRRTTKPSEKAQVTARTNDELQQLENHLAQLLEEAAPVDAELSHTPGNEDAVIHATDDHVGDLTEDEFGELTYDPEVWKHRRTKTFDKAYEVIGRQMDAGYEFDTLHLLLGGDIVTGEGIYQSQAHDLAWPLSKQLDEASKFYMRQIRRAANIFDTVQVVCQSGNHGELRFSGASKTANADRWLYMMLENMVEESELENVKFTRNSATGFTNFEMRGHKGHLRHGDNSLEHIGTSSAKRRWFKWRDIHQFAVAYRGHFHVYERDTLTRTFEEYVRDESGNILTDEDGEPLTETVTENVPVIMTGSPKPPEEFEESIARWSQPSATIHGVSDEEPVTWLRCVDFE